MAPDGPVKNTEVGGTQAEAAGIGIVRGQQRIGTADERTVRLPCSKKSGKRGILFAVADRIEAQHSSLGSGIDVPELHLKRMLSAGVGLPNRHSTSRGNVRRSDSRIGRTSDLRQTDVVRVWIENDHAQTRSDQQL